MRFCNLINICKSSKHTDLKTRIIIFISLFTFFSVWICGMLFLNFNVMKYLVPAMYPMFADLVTVTYSVDCLNAGCNPFLDSSFDPFHRTYNYPGTLLYIFQFLHLGGSKTFYIALSLISVYLASISFILTPKDLSYRKTIYLMLFLFSPALLLLIERCNIDIIIFLIILLTIKLRYSIQISEKFNNLIQYISLCFATIIKLYPAFALFALIISNPKKSKIWIPLSSMIFLFIVLLYVIRDQLILVKSNTPQETFASYGKNVLFQGLFGRAPWINHTTLAIVLIILGLIAARYYFAKVNSSIEYIPKVSSFKHQLFITGASIYIASFIISNNFEYRLVFWLLTLPLLFDYTEIKHKRNLTQIAMLCMLIRTWQYLPFNYFDLKKHSIVVGKVTFIVEQVCTWVVLAALFIFLIDLLLSRSEFRSVFLKNPNKIDSLS